MILHLAIQSTLPFDDLPCCLLPNGESLCLVCAALSSPPAPAARPQDVPSSDGPPAAVSRPASLVVRRAPHTYDDSPSVRVTAFNLLLPLPAVPSPCLPVRSLQIGLLGLIGSLGVFTAPLIGRSVDRLRSPRYATLLAVALLFVSGAIMVGAGGLSVCTFLLQLSLACLASRSLVVVL